MGGMGRLIFLFALCAAMLAELPNFFGALQEKFNPSIVFLWSGFPWDSNQYLAFMRVGFRGDWMFTNLLTSEPSPPVFLMPFFVALGHAARWLRGAVDWFFGWKMDTWTTLLFTYRAARMAMTFALALSVFWLSGRFTRSTRRRFWITAYALFANGILWGRVFATESSTLSSCILFPNFNFSLVCYTVLMGAFLGALKSDVRWGAGGGAGFQSGGTAFDLARAAVAGLCLAYVHPFDLPSVGLVWCVALAWRWGASRLFPRRLAAVGAVFCLFAGGAVLQQKWVSWTVPEFGKIDTGNVMPWVSWWDPIRTLELFLIIAAAGVPVLWRSRHRPESLFALAWLAGALGAMCLPLPFQRRTIEGVPLALAFAAVAAVEGWLAGPLRRAGVRWARAAALGVVFLLLLPKTCWILYDRAVTYKKPNDYYYSRVLELKALNWLEGEGNWREVVLTSPWQGNRVAFVSGHRSYLAHAVMTVDYFRKEKVTAGVFRRTMPVEEFRRWVREANIRYIFWTERDRASDAKKRDFDSYDPETLGKPVYQNPYARIYRLRY